MEPRRLVDAVAHRQALAKGARRLGQDPLAGSLIQFPQGCKQLLGLGLLVTGGAVAAHRPFFVIVKIPVFIKAQHRVMGLHLLFDGPGRGIRRALEQQHRRFGGIVPVFHAGRPDHFARRHFVKDSAVYLHAAQHPQDLLPGDSAGPQHPRDVPGHIHHGGFHAHLAGAAV